MSINATIDETLYEGIETILVGGKTVLLSETGGGGGGSSTYFDSGEITLTEDQDYIEITGLDFVPKVFAVRLKSPINDTELSGGAFGVMDCVGGWRSNTGGSLSFNGFMRYTQEGVTESLETCVLSQALNVTGSLKYQRTETGFRITKASSSGFPFAANHTYSWLAVGWAEEE